MNKAIIKGRITADVELRATQSGKSVIGFTVAVDDYKDTYFIECVAWNEQAERIAQYFNKGKEILIDGRIITRSYEDKNGNKRKTTEVVVDKWEFCGGKTENKADNVLTEQTTPLDVQTPDEDDLPF